MSYVAPIKDMLFGIRHLANIDQIAQMPGFEEAGFDTAQAVLEEAGKFNESVVSPLNWEGDRNPSAWKDGTVSTTPGFRQAYLQFAEGGESRVNEAGNYTKPGMRKSLFNSIKSGGKGGAPGQWSARKAQMLAQQYKAKGGGYRD